jgi:hypothetical protein
MGGEAFGWRPWDAGKGKGREKRLLNKKGQWEVDDEAWGLLEIVWPKPGMRFPTKLLLRLSSRDIWEHGTSGRSVTNICARFIDSRPGAIDGTLEPYHEEIHKWSRYQGRYSRYEECECAVQSLGNGKRNRKRGGSIDTHRLEGRRRCKMR